VQSKCLAKCEADFVVSLCNCRTTNMPGEVSIAFATIGGARRQCDREEAGADPAQKKMVGGGHEFK